MNLFQQVLKFDTCIFILNFLLTYSVSNYLYANVFSREIYRVLINNNDLLCKYTFCIKTDFF
jgi:hypothetical protein